MKSILTTALFLMAGLVFGQLKGAPDWVLDPPSDDFAFHGIGYANPSENDNYRMHARNLALRELAEKIFVSIDATSELQVKYENEQISYFLDERVEVASSNYLMGYEIVDEWRNKKSTAYYVLFRLDRVTYMENRRKFFQQLYDIVDVMEASADELIEEGQVIRGINELSEALLRIDQEMHTVIEPEYSRHLEKEKLALVYKMERVLSRLSFDVDGEYAVDMSDPKPFVISNYVTDAVSGEPVHHLNAKLLVLQGDVFRYRFDRTTERDALLVEGFFPERGYARVRIQVEPPIPKKVKQSIDEAVLRRLTSPTIDLKFEPYDIKIVDASDEDSPYDDYLRTITKDLGLNEVTDSPDLYIFVDTESVADRRGRSTYVGQFDGRIWINRDASSIPDFEYSLPKKTYYASDRYKARNEAYNKTVLGSSDFLVEFVSYLCSKHP